MAVMQPIQFEPETLGHILKDKYLHVPTNQRPYSWEKEHVEDLYSDLWGALEKEEYFLGSIVVVKSGDRLEVNDGQQRLATTLILLAAIRDYFVKAGDVSTANKIQSKFLLAEDDLSTEETNAKFNLSGQDHEFFLNRVLRGPTDAARIASKKTVVDRPSNKRILKAFSIAKTYVHDIGGATASTPEQKKKALLGWIKFLENAARVIWVQVADARTAYLIFETMNDRGLKLSSADLLKNYIYGRAEDREEEAVTKWQTMAGILEKLEDGESAVVDYIRYLWISRNGHIRSRELYDKVKESIKTKTQALTEVAELESRARDYAALCLSAHEFWAPYGTTVKTQIQTLNQLGAKQLRPMLLAALPRFSVKEMQNLLRACVCWSVRCLLSGVPSGTVEGYYSKIALKIHKKEITKVAQVTTEMLPLVPDDAKFESAVATCNVAQTNLSRFYLHSLQRKKDGDQEPEYISNDLGPLTLEHVLPENPGPEWAHIQKDAATQLVNRLGNQALLKGTVNSSIGNVGFDEKKKAFAASELSLTKEISQVAVWDADAIGKRQQELAELAVKTWPLKH